MQNETGNVVTRWGNDAFCRRPVSSAGAPRKMSMTRPPFWLIGVVLAAGLATAPGAAAADRNCAAIGTATMEKDGAIVLRLGAYGPNGTVGDGVLRYAPGQRDFAAIAAHVGPLKPGETVAVCPWPDDPPNGKHPAVK